MEYEKGADRVLGLDLEEKNIYLAYGDLTLGELMDWLINQGIPHRDVKIISSGDPYCGVTFKW